MQPLRYPTAEWDSREAERHQLNPQGLARCLDQKQTVRIWAVPVNVFVPPPQSDFGPALSLGTSALTQT